MSADVLVRRGSGYMHIVALTYQPEFTVIRDPSCRRCSPPCDLLPICAGKNHAVRLNFDSKMTESGQLRHDYGTSPY